VAGGLIGGHLPAQAEPGPQGLFQDLNQLDTMIKALTTGVEKDELGIHRMTNLVGEIDALKERMMRAYFQREDHGIELGTVFLRLDCLDSKLALGYGKAVAQGKAKPSDIADDFRFGKICLDRLRSQLRGANAEPAGILTDLKAIDDKVAELIKKEEGSSPPEVPSIEQIGREKRLFVDKYFNPKPAPYGVPFPDWYRALDLVDHELALGLGKALARGRLGREDILDNFQRAERIKTSLLKEVRTNGNAEPVVDDFASDFFPKGSANPCENAAGNVNYGETCYKVKAFDDDGDRLTYAWDLVPPVQDPTCNVFHVLADTQTAVWHHGDEDHCDHTKEGPDGHEGTVWATVKDGSYTCVVTYLGTNSNPTNPNFFSDCFPAGKNVLALAKAMIGPSGGGTGTVTSSPAGINCDTSCSGAAAAFAPSSQVTLTATADSSSTFVGWSGGGCSGTSTCSLTVSSDQTVMATFSHN